MCMKVNEGEWREMNVYELMQISIGQRVTALRLGAIPVINGQSSWLTLEISQASKGPRGDWIQVPITSENERVLLDEKNSEPHDGD